MCIRRLEPRACKKFIIIMNALDSALEPLAPRGPRRMNRQRWPSIMDMLNIACHLYSVIRPETVLESA